MKIITLILFTCFCLFFIQTNAQPINKNLPQYFLNENSQKQLQPDSVLVYSFKTENDSIPALKSVFEYQPEAQLSIETIFEWEANTQSWLQTAKNELKKDEQGNIYYTALYTWDAAKNQWVCQYIDENLVDSKGNILIQAYYRLRDWNETENGYRMENTYNEQGLKTSQTTFTWDVQKKQWKAGNKETWEFDSNGEMIGHNYYEWRNDLNDWLLTNQYKYEYQYNEQGKIIIWLESKWDIPSAAWIQSSRSLYTYNDQGYLINELLFYGTNTWASSRTDYENDERGNVLLVINYTRSNGAWAESSKYEYAYDAQDNQTVSAWYNWDNALKTWNGMSKTEEAFNEKGNTILFISYHWDVNNISWVPANKNETQLSNGGNQKISTGFIWNIQTQGWEYDWKNEEQYDQYGNLEFYASYDWNMASNQWEAIYRNQYDYSYNNEGGIVMFVFSPWSSTQTYPFIYEKTFFYYPSKTSKALTGILPQLKIYPNPVTDYLFISGAEHHGFSIVDSKGKIWMNFINRQGVVDVKELPDGIYFIRIAEGSKQQVKRFIKNKH